MDTSTITTSTQAGKTLRHFRTQTFPSQPNSRLLSLPAELRNSILALALTSETPLRYHWMGESRQPIFVQIPNTDDITSKTLPDVFEFNKVKFVCRQLYTETATIELSINHIMFSGGICKTGDELDPARLFDQFLKSGPFDQTIMLKHVNLEFMKVSSVMRNSVEYAPYLVQVAEFCRRNPSTRVDYIIRDEKIVTCPDPDIALRMLLIKGIWLTWYFRGTDLRHIAPIRWSQTAWERAASMATTLDVPNLRIKLNTNSSIHGILFDGKSDELEWILDPEKRRKYLQYAKEWLKHGI